MEWYYALPLGIAIGGLMIRAYLWLRPFVEYLRKGGMG